MSIVAPFTVLLAFAAPASDDCAALRSGHEGLLDGAFTVERHLTVVMNGKLKIREVARLTYRERRLSTEQLELELLDGNLVFEESETDPALDMSFDCDRVARVGGGRYRLHSEDGAEELELVLESDRHAFVPVVWRSRETERFLWKKFEIETEASYRGFEWQD